ncbi:MAG: ThuA domain-containing protein [Planctomycetales bacterium]|nr:ThuA domain-containing protein [Planctomycetales bacterium]
MNVIRAKWLCIVFLGISLVSVLCPFVHSAETSSAEPESPAALFRAAKRILFLGDSITAAGDYIADLEAWALTQSDSPPHIINAGLPSETVSGLSEDGHAGGAFPRPDLHERLARVLAITKPDLVVACYGMNCGIYEPFDESRFARYRDGIARLRTAVQESGAKLIHVTPPVYDDHKAPREGFAYNEVLDRYSDWLVSQRANGWAVIDLHGPMTRELAHQRTANPEFAFQEDGVHPNRAGHWFIAKELIGALGDKSVVTSSTPEQFVAARSLPADIIAAVRRRMTLLRDAYVGAAGHKRPGVAAGLPIESAESQAADLTKQIAATVAAAGAQQDNKLLVLIVDGQNNHGMWPKTTQMMKRYLEDTGLFTVEIARTAFTWQGDDLLKTYSLPGVTTTPLPQPKTDPNFKPDFARYDVVLSNLGFGAAPWPAETQEAFDRYVREGGGFVVVHAADNSFGDWQAYNKMIGIGGWGGRNEKSGPYIYLDADGNVVRDTSPGSGGHHGPQHPFEIIVRDTDHPITRGLPRAWLHAQDELYDLLRGPGENMHILATAYADPQQGGSGRHEPMLLTIEYGQGRVFHTPMGHADYSMECVGFITCLQRGTEWAATGRVTQTQVPADFPTTAAPSQRKSD